MFHMTSLSSALRIMKHGFDPLKARTKAFGNGINVSANFLDVLQYAPDDACIIVCIVRYTLAMPNESDCTQMIHEVFDDGSEAFYSKPKYMYPPEGYDALYADDIYIFPSSEQVIPFFLIRCQNLLKN